MDKIDTFRGEYAFLSNFYPCKVWLIYRGERYCTNSAEHAYQALKADGKLFLDIINAASPGLAKRLGRRATLPPDWEDTKLLIMENILREKFSDPELGKKLVKIAPAELIEGNWWGDTFWGVCRGVGKNHLGKLLMKLREELIQYEGELEG